jgi:hypothetical protein
MVKMAITNGRGMNLYWAVALSAGRAYAAVFDAIGENGWLAQTHAAVFCASPRCSLYRASCFAGSDSTYLRNAPHRVLRFGAALSAILFI